MRRAIGAEGNPEGVIYGYSYNHSYGEEDRLFGHSFIGRASYADKSKGKAGICPHTAG